MLWVLSASINIYHKTSSGQRSQKTPGQRNSVASTCTKVPLDAELVSCSENTFKQTQIEQTRCRVQLFRARTSRHEQFHRGVRFQPSCAPPPSHQSRIHVICTASGIGTLQLFCCAVLKVGATQSVWIHLQLSDTQSNRPNPVSAAFQCPVPEFLLAACERSHSTETTWKDNPHWARISRPDRVEQHQDAVVSLSSSFRQVTRWVHSHLRAFL